MRFLFGIARLWLALVGFAAGLAIFVPHHSDTVSAAVTPSVLECLLPRQQSTIQVISAFEAAFFRGDPITADPLLDSALTEIRVSLLCNPAQPELWTAAANLSALRDGLTDQVQTFLRLSCRTGPYLSWTAKARLTGFDRLRAALPLDLVECLDRDRLTTARRPT